MLLKVWSKKTY